MKKIFKKLVSVPNKFEAFLQRRKLPTLIIILAFCVFALFGLWWYGAYDNLFKSPHTFDINQVYDEYAGNDLKYSFQFNEAYEKVDSTFPKRFASITTKAMVESYFSSYPSAYHYLDANPQKAYEYIRTMGGEGSFYDAFFDELSRRNNAGVALAQSYLEMPVLYTENGDVMYNPYLMILEAVLAQPEYRKNLPPWYSIAILRKMKQKEKFSFIGTEEAMLYGEEDFVFLCRYNFLYTDAYDENGWDEEKLNEYAGKYIDLEEWGYTE